MKLRVEVASVPDRKDLVSEIRWGNEMVADITYRAQDTFALEIYQNPQSQTWLFDAEDFVSAANHAIERLKRMKRLD